MGISMVPTLISVEEYLNTDYSPDCDYVDGVLEDRNVGQNSHADAQKRALLFLSRLEKEIGMYVIQEQRIETAPGRYRVPDLCVMLGGNPAQAVFTTAPFLCIEVLSSDDRMSRMLTKIQDYVEMGVKHVWIIDPESRLGWMYNGGLAEAKDGILRTSDPAIEMPLAEVLP